VGVSHPGRGGGTFWLTPPPLPSVKIRQSYNCGVQACADSCHHDSLVSLGLREDHGKRMAATSAPQPVADPGAKEPQLPIPTTVRGTPTIAATGKSPRYPSANFIGL